MKKYVNLLLFFLVFFNFSMIICAEEYTCQYNNEDGIGTGFGDADKTYDFNLKIDTEKKTIRSTWVAGEDKKEDKGATTGEINAIADTAYDSSKDEKYYVNLFNGKCISTIYVCKFTGKEWFQNTWSTNYVVLFNSSYYEDIVNMEPSFYTTDTSDQWRTMYKNKKACEDERGEGFCEIYNINNKTEDCKKFDYYDGDYDGKKESVDIDFKCDYYEKIKKELKSLTTKYKDCTKKNTYCGSEATNHAEKLDRLKEYCRNVISHQDFKMPCMTSCLGLNQKLRDENLLITDTDVEIKCSLTEDILSMVYNVLKWAKYIAPVLVIILSMLDFIKAIASQSDDEMKKAQGKFVKRLIVAALLFLLPFIINFVLKTFGFYNSKCDITDLF